MSQHPEPNQHVRRVVLPSGKTIEVVYFDETQALDAASPGLADVGEELHVCGECSSDLVFPVEWDEAGATHWEVTLRCPNCEWAGTGIFEQELVERFTTALAEDHIVPEDF